MPNYKRKWARVNREAVNLLIRRYGFDRRPAEELVKYKYLPDDTPETFAAFIEEKYGLVRIDRR